MADSPDDSSLEASPVPARRSRFGLRELIRSRAGRVQGDQVRLLQSGTLLVDARTLEINQGAVVYARGDRLDMRNSQSALSLSRGGSEFQQSASGVTVSGGSVNLHQSASGAVIARDVSLRDSASVFVIARSITGSVRTLFGPRESVLFALVAGLAAGVAFAITRALVGTSRSAGSSQRGE